MTVENMIQFLRTSVYIQDKDSVVKVDPQYLCMTDEDILSYLDIVRTRNYPEVPTVALMPEESIYGLILLAKKELYCTLAVKEAPLYDMGADNNNYLKRSQRFDHYMKLAEDAAKEYDDWLENGGGEDALGTVRSYHVTLSDRYNTRYNYENAAVPKVTLYIMNVTDTTAELYWTVKNLSRFFKYNVYISEDRIVDPYSLVNRVSKDAKCVCHIDDIHQTQVRLTELTPETQYHVAIEVVDMALHKGYSELIITTTATPNEEEGE